jgi:uncharacterized membrane protein YfcA
VTPIEPLEFALLGGIAFSTALLSAVVGMAGGIILLSFMLLWMEPLVAIPLHGVIQLVSNGSRSWIQRRHVEWPITWRYALLLLPFGWLGLQLALALPPHLTKLLIGVFVLAATWRPGWLLFGAHPERSDRNRRFLVLGGAAGFLNVTIGAVGPLIAPFFLNLGLARQAIVGTKAACQALGHVTKIGLYGAIGFAFGDYALLLVVLCALVVAGTWTGSRLLEHTSERGFTLLFKTALTLVALRLVLLDGWRWLVSLQA